MGRGTFIFRGLVLRMSRGTWLAFLPLRRGEGLLDWVSARVGPLKRPMDTPGRVRIPG